MSFYPSKLVFHPSDYPWKIFVKGSNELHITKNPVENCIFRGEDARKSYEEIVHSKSKVDSKPPTIDKIAPISKPKKATNVTVNSILKAIEQRDVKFLKNCVSPENVNLTDDFGWSPLMVAAYCGYLEIVELLLKSGANKRTREKSGWTAAQLALKKNYLDIVALLRKKDLPLEEVATNPEPDSKPKNPENYSEEIYCETCKGKFVESPRRKHENSILHVFSSKPKLVGTFFGISRFNKGYQMLLSTGWDEESGLGPSGKGSKYPVKTVLKTDRKGLGQAKPEARITHFKSGEVIRISKPKVATKKDREKLLSRENRKDRALRAALS